MNHLIERLEPESVPYASWYESHRPKENDLAKLKKENREDDPLISVVVPAYETDERYLRELLDSVTGQTYENWELCIADASDRTDTVERVLKEYGAQTWGSPEPEKEPGDRSRIKYIRLGENKGISENTNAAIRAASGEYIGFMDHDDLLAPHALRLMANAAIGGADMIYSDEDKVTPDLKKHFQPNFKPEFNLDLLRSNNYITHFLCISKKLLDSAGLLRSEFDGAQDHDLAFRCAEKAEKITRVPEILYHWRSYEGSTSDNPMSKQYAYDAGKRAVEGSLERTGTKGEVSLLKDFGFYRVKYPVQKEDHVSVIIPNKDHREDLSKCLASLNNTEYKNFEVIIVENNSETDGIFEYYKEIEKQDNVKVLKWDREFNYAAINNFGARHASGEYLLFMNNDVSASIDPGWLSEMLGVCQRKEVGVVGAKLYYPNDRIQHAGCVIGIGNMAGGGVAGAMFTDMPRSRSGYMHKASLMQDMSAVTAALMMVKKSVFNEAGGFTEELTVAFNDIDLCLKIRELGYLVVYDPYVEAYHDESRSRGAEDSEEKRRRFQSEIEYMRSHWTKILKEGDPYYNPNLSLKKWDYSLKP